VTRLRTLTLVLLAGLLLLAPAAPAKTAWKRLGEARTPQLETDPRYAAYEDPNGVTRLFDSETNRRTKHRRPIADCPFTNLGGGRIMWACRAYPVHIAFETIRTGRIGQRDLEAGDSAGGAHYIGKYWVKGAVNDANGNQYEAWWRLSDGTRGPEVTGARRIDDLDRPGLVRELCSPLQRKPNPFFGMTGDTRPYAAYQFDGRFGLTADGFQWVLQRCGQKPKPVTLGLNGGELTAGRIAYFDRGDIVVLDAATRRKTTWSVTDIEPTADGAVVRVTANRIFVAVFRGADGFAPSRVYTARLPK
jgi:hypothetical protein